jgi:hypothetical protein
MMEGSVAGISVRMMTRTVPFTWRRYAEGIAILPFCYYGFKFYGLHHDPRSVRNDSTQKLFLYHSITENLIRNDGFGLRQQAHRTIPFHGEMVEGGKIVAVLL